MYRDKVVVGNLPPIFSPLFASTKQCIQHGLTLNELQNVFWWSLYSYGIISLQGTKTPHLYLQNRFWEHLQLKPTDRVFAYILTIDKAITRKLDPNIKQVKCYITVDNQETKGVGLGHVTYF